MKQNLSLGTVAPPDYYSGGPSTQKWCYTRGFEASECYNQQGQQRDPHGIGGVTRE